MNDSHSALKRIAVMQQQLASLIRDLDELQYWQEDDEFVQSHLESAADYIRYALGELARAEEKIESEKEA